MAHGGGSRGSEHRKGRSAASRPGTAAVGPPRRGTASCRTGAARGGGHRRHALAAREGRVVVVEEEEEDGGRRRAEGRPPRTPPRAVAPVVSGGRERRGQTGKFSEGEAEADYISVPPDPDEKLEKLSGREVGEGREKTRTEEAREKTRRSGER